MNFQITTSHTCSCQLVGNRMDSCFARQWNVAGICWWLFFSSESVNARTNVCHQIITFRWQIDICFCERSSQLTSCWLFRYHLFANINWNGCQRVFTLLIQRHIWNVRCVCVFNMFDDMAVFSLYSDRCSQWVRMHWYVLTYDFNCNTRSCRIVAYLQPSENQLLIKQLWNGMGGKCCDDVVTHAIGKWNGKFLFANYCCLIFLQASKRRARGYLRAV